MAAVPASQEPTMNSMQQLRAFLKQPAVIMVLLIAYVAIVTALLLNLNTSDRWYYAKNMCLFPLFMIAPTVIIVTPLKTDFKLLLGGFVLLALLPVIGIYNSSYLSLAANICIFAGLALGLNIVVGFAGLLDLGYVAFFAVGAYMWAMFTSPTETYFRLEGLLVPDWSFYLFIFGAVIVAGLVGVLLGLPVLRLRGDYLAIVTLGFGEVIRVLARNANAPTNFTNGSQGLRDIGHPPVPQTLIGLTDGLATDLGFHVQNVAPVATNLLFYLIGIAILGIIIVIAARLNHSAIGRAWTAIREDEVAAIAMGVPLVRMKLLAFASGASFGGAMGVLYGAKQTFIDPTSFALILSITILAMVIVGGMGSIRGVLLGAIIITLLDQHMLQSLSNQISALRNVDYVIPIINFNMSDWPIDLDPSKYQPLLFGLILVSMMLFRPAGLLPEQRRKLELQRHKEPVEVEIETPAESDTSPTTASEAPPGELE